MSLFQSQRFTINKSQLSRLRLISNISLGHGVRPSLVYRIGKDGFKTPRYQNNYRLEPYNPYNCEVVDRILADVMQSSLRDVRYHPVNCLKICQDMSATVRDRVNRKSYDRYKLVVLMTIVQKLGQGVYSKFAGLWDAERDTYSTYVFETSEFTAVGVVVAVYYE